MDYGTISCTASALRAMLQYIDPEGGPRITYDDDSLATALCNKVRDAVGEEHGSRSVTITFDAKEKDLFLQFTGVAKKIFYIFRQISELLE